MDGLERIGGIESGSSREQKVENHRLKPIPYKLDELVKEPKLLQKLVDGICQSNKCRKDSVFGRKRYKQYNDKITVANFLRRIAKKQQFEWSKRGKKKIARVGREK